MTVPSGKLICPPTGFVILHFEVQWVYTVYRSLSRIMFPVPTIACSGSIHRFHRYSCLDDITSLLLMMTWTVTLFIYLEYRFRPNYRALRFFTITGQTCGKICIHLYYKDTLRKRWVKDLSNDSYAIFFVFFYSDFLIWIASTSWCNSNGYPQHMHKNYTGCRGVVGWCEGAVYLTSLGRPTDIGLQLGKACYPCSG